MAHRVEHYQRFQRRSPQDYALEQERDRHEEALLALGEYVLFILLWQVPDYEAGLVGRCWCVGDTGVADDVDEAIAATYRQSAKKECTDCWGTTFEGGWKAKLVRPAIVDITAEALEQLTPRGEVDRHTANVQTTGDLRLHAGDWFLRGDCSRWQMAGLDTTRLYTGFQPVATVRQSVGFNYGRANLEDPETIIYQMPPDCATLQATLGDARGGVGHLDFAAIEEQRGPIDT